MPAAKGSATPSVTFDIATKILSPDQQIWAIFPGLGRRFFNRFHGEEVIFLETPAINLTSNALRDDEVLRQHVAMSLKWIDYYKGGGELPPSRRASNYDPPKNASFNAAVGNVRNVFVKMQPGDLVLVGGYSYYEPVLIGEIKDPFDPKFVVHLEQYGMEEVPARRVHWLNRRTERRFLSRGLSLLLSNRKAVVSVNKGEYGDEIYRLAYGDYVFGSNSRYIFEGPKYNNIATSTVPGINLITYFAAAFNAAELGEIETFGKLSVQKAIDNYFEQDVLYSFEIDFSSPGEYVLYAKRAVLPLLVAVLVSATDGNISNVQEARGGNIVNSAASA